MPRLRVGRSFWLDALTFGPQRFPTLRGRVTADVAIVGGGITGCAAALLFARAGATVVLLESRRIGRGSTAASTALLMQEPDADFTDLTRRYGTTVTRRIWTCCRDAVDSFKQLLRDVGAPAVHALPSVYYAREARHVDKLGRELRLRQRARLGGRWLDPRAIRGLAGIDAEGGILTPGNAQVDPYRGCLAIARAAVRDGASLHEHAHVRRIQRNRDAVDLTLENGARVSAGVAVIATGYATPEFEPFSSRFRMMNTYVVATRRLTTRERREVGLGDVMLWDSGRPYYYARWTADGRLLFGGRDRPRLRGAMRPATLRRVAAQLTADLATLWPSLEGVRPEYAWEGLFAQTPDGLPFIGTHRRYPRQLFALGYGGNGMTLGFFAARAVVRIAQGRPGPDDHLFAMSRFSRAHRYSR